MVFNSLEFALFLPIVFFAYWILPHKYRWLILLISSYHFYMAWNVEYSVLIFGMTFFSYVGAILIDTYHLQNTSRGKYLLIVESIICIGILAIFKYGNFFIENFSDIYTFFAGKKIEFGMLNLLLPVGISFYTFQTLSYVVDVYTEKVKAEHHFGIYATFISFFPQLVAGPIERTDHLLPQLKRENYFDYDSAVHGLKLMGWGLYKKVIIADNLAPYVNMVFNDVTSHSGFVFVVVAFLFSVQIYCDFSGYSDIARGCAKLFGIELIQNFNRPYFARSIKDFWRRWHISLSMWFRDYVYIPLGGGQKSFGRTTFNLITTFFISGLWHGANWTFVVWGVLHGTMIAVENAVLYYWSQEIWYKKYAGYVYTFCFVVVAWIFFRANNLGDAFFVLEHMFDGSSHPLDYIRYAFSREFGIGMNGHAKIICLLFYLLPLFLVDKYNLVENSNQVMFLKNDKVRWGIYIVVIFVCWALLPIASDSEFIYFQF